MMLGNVFQCGVSFEHASSKQLRVSSRSGNLKEHTFESVLDFELSSFAKKSNSQILFILFPIVKV